MGSGKGKARRAQSKSTATGSWADVDKQRWAQFLEQSGTRKVSLLTYYRTKKSTRKQEAEELACHLYADLVGIGAIRFPSGEDVEDFKVSIDNRPSVYAGIRPVTTLLLTRIATGEERIIRQSPLEDLHTGNRLGGRKVERIVGDLLAAFYPA